MTRRILIRFLSFILILSGLVLGCCAAEDASRWIQADPRWNRQEAWPQSQYPDAASRTMQEGGDQVTALAMLLRQYGLASQEDFSPWQCLEKLKQADAFDPGGRLIWSRIEDAFPGLHFENRVEYSFQKISALYDYGFACILELKGLEGDLHCAAVRSVNARSVSILDPASGETELKTPASVASVYYFSLGTPDQEAQEYAMFPAPVMEVTQLAYESFSHGIANAIDIIPHGELIAPFRCTVTFTDPSWGYVVLQSTGKVLYADGTLDYMTVSYVHSEDIGEMVRAQKSGRIICQGEPIYHAGGMGRWNPNAFREHVHLAAYRGHVSAVTEDGYYGCGDVYPYDAFLVNPRFTTDCHGRGEGYKSTDSFMYQKAPDDYRGRWKQTDLSGNVPIHGLSPEKLPR